MPHNYQIVDFSARMPVRCGLYHIGRIDRHLHDFFELVMVLRGTCTAEIDDQSYVLHEEDIIAIDPHVPHAYRGQDSALIAVQFDAELFERTLPNPTHPRFDCNSSVQGNSISFDRLRRLIARLVKNNAEQRQGYELHNWSIVYELMDELYNNFRIIDSGAQYARAHRYAVRMKELTTIISERHTEPLTLTELAAEVHLSAPYLSKFFDRQFGMSYLSYLTQIRLQHAIRLLLQTEDTIEMVSAESGFPNSHAFVQAFRKEYECLPSVYRRRARAEQATKSNSVTAPEQHDDLAVLRKYLETPAIPSDQEQVISINVRAAADRPIRSLRHTWRNVVALSAATDLLQGNIRQILRRVQSEIGCRYIKFNGILSDEMRVYSETADGTPVYNYTYIDQVLDFLVEIRLRPLLQLSFMPSALARDKDRYLTNFLVSEPRDVNRWAELVRAVIRHCIQRYGIAEVRTWLFSVWSQPDTPEDLYGFSSDEAFYTFYEATRQAVKGCDPSLQFGAPAMYYVLQSGYMNWYIDFLLHCRAQNCMPDFLNFHYYDTTFVDNTFTATEDSDHDTFGFFYAMCLRENPDGFNDFVTQVISEVHEQCPEGIPIYLTAWNNTPSQQDLLNDTCFKSCYITKGILENYDRLDSYAYWALSDLMGEAALPEETFYGGVGLFTKEGMPKAGYYALTLLRRLGDELLSHGPGWFITRSSTGWQIILYNYRHFSHLYAQGERFDMTFTNRYTPFSPEQQMDVHLRLTDMEDGDYLITTESLGRHSGSVYDQWCAMGAVDPITAEDRDYLMRRSVPERNKYTVSATDGDLTLDALLDLLEVRLLLITKA